MIAGYLILFLICALLSFLLFYVPKKFGYPRLGTALSLAFAVFLAYHIITDIYRDELFSKSDAIELLSELNLELHDDFEILKSETFVGMQDYSHDFTLDISSEDLLRIKNEIIESDNFNQEGPENPQYSDDQHYRYNAPKWVGNYGRSPIYMREIFETFGEGYTPLWLKVTIDESKNQLVYADWDL